ncbi:hypothetical protein P3X46_016392 [Hevea brasiliensis]|uniref:tRNA/rRNA methyltransferase SpoU type domain-containing protein n=1 Tax=Hevea brasiliensis TaxID=3981 RepID=A0ABQ9M0T5_HEVBR|nr:hypothetical protein P3X46_016392 [Hevea brasiliensis]
MRSCKTLTLIRTSISSVEKSKQHFFNSKSFFPFSLRSVPFLSLNFHLLSRSLPGSSPCGVRARPYGTLQGAISLESTEFEAGESQDNSEKNDTIEYLLNNRDDVSRLMKMERRLSPVFDSGVEPAQPLGRWFPYLDRFKCGNGVYLNSGEVLEAVGPYIMEERKERFRSAVINRSYSVCLVVEGLSDFGNVSAAFRSADALGFQSVHVVSCDSSKRYRDNRHVSMGAEKWLDIELWDSTQECFQVLKSRGYQIATTRWNGCLKCPWFRYMSEPLSCHAQVSIYDMDWSCPIAIVVGNENRGISDEALEQSDLHCSIPMKGMVDSFNVSVAAGILMHHAVCDRTSRLGCHGDLTSEESQILLAEFSLRHSKSAISIAHEYAKRKAAVPLPKL